MPVVRFLAGIATTIAYIAIILSPALVGALWLYAGAAVWRDFGGLGVAAWNIPTLALSLYLPWSSYRSTKSMVEISGLSQEEQIGYYQRSGAFPMGLTFVFGMVAFQFQHLAQRGLLLRILLWLSLAVFTIEAAVTIFCSWLATGIVFGSFLGIVGIVVGALVPMLLFFHWISERDRLIKSHPECVGGT
jgi:hypothetical protein